MPLPASRQIASVDSMSPGTRTLVGWMPGWASKGRGAPGARREGGRARRGGGRGGPGVTPRLLLRFRVAHQPLRLVGVGEEAHQPAVLDQVGAAGGKPLAGYPLAADEPGGGAAVAA